MPARKGVALRRGPFSHGWMEGKAGREEEGVPDGEQWRWSAIGAYPTLDMAVAVGEGFLSVKPYRVRRVTDVGDGFHDFLAEESSLTH